MNIYHCYFFNEASLKKEIYYNQTIHYLEYVNKGYMWPGLWKGVL